MTLHLFTRQSSRRSRAGAARRRPIFDDLEGRLVMSTSTMAAPAAIPAHVSARAASQVHVAVPLSISQINLTGITRDTTTGALTATGTVVGSLLGHTFQTPVVATVMPAATPGAVPVLHLELNPIHLDLLGLKVDTSRICLNITAHPGPGNLLGNLLGGLSGLLDSATTAANPTSALLPLNNMLNDGNLLHGLNGILGRETSQAGSPTVTGPTTNILNLSIGPVDLNLLGLEVALDNCKGGPVTVSLSAQAGSGKLLGNLLSSVAHLLDVPGNPTGAITSKINRVLGIVRGL